MDAYLAVVSKREVRRYDGRPLPDDAVRRLLEAGRIAGSSRNRQARRFVVLRDRALVERAAAAVHVPENVLGAALVIAVVIGGKGPTAFDAGRAAQNMMLAAWNDGIGSCPNGISDSEALAAIAGAAEGEQVAIVLTFGYPARPVDPESRSPKQWIERADRVPFDQAVDER
jgi:nitroreductase